jgi:hypothetical protein
MRGEEFLKWVIDLSINWSAIGAIASAIASIAALITIVITIKTNRDNNDEKQFAVQPWFHVTYIERMGSSAPLRLVLLNDASPTIKIDKIIMVLNENNEVIELDYRYLKKDNPYVPTGKCFEVVIKNDEVLFGKSSYLEIYYTNLYNKKMKAVSPCFKFVGKVNENSLLDIESRGFLYIPFKNEIIKK